MTTTCRVKQFLRAIALTLPILLSTGLSSPGLAQDATVTALDNSLRQAVCRNDWNEALRLINDITTAPGVDLDYRSQMLTFRQQVLEWRNTRATVAASGNCGGVAAQGFSTGAPRSGRTYDWGRGLLTYPDLATMPTGVARIDDCNLVGAYLVEESAQVAAIASTVTPENPSPFLELLNAINQVKTTLQRMPITDAGVRRYTQQLVATYGDIEQTGRDIVAAMNNNNTANLPQLEENLLEATQRESSLLSATESYCTR